MLTTMIFIDQQKTFEKLDNTIIKQRNEKTFN